MAKKVLKFGGTSVGTIERILHVAKIIKKEHDAKNEVIAIVSAMAGKKENIWLSVSLKTSFFCNKDRFCEFFYPNHLLTIRRTSAV